MKLTKAVLGLSLVTTALGLGSLSAEAFTLKGHLDGAEFDALQVEVPWAAESRIGGISTTEINIHDETNTTQNRVEANYNWLNGEVVNFSLAFDSFANTLTYSVGDVVVSQTDIVENFSDIYIRTRAATEGSSVVVNNLFLQDSQMASGLADFSSASCSSGVGCSYFDADYLHISNIMGSFMLSGQSTMSWLEGFQPSQSSLAYQIKLTDETDVPEPGSLLSLSLLGLWFVCKRKQKS